MSIIITMIVAGIFLTIIMAIINIPVAYLLRKEHLIRERYGNNEEKL